MSERSLGNAEIEYGSFPYQIIRLTQDAWLIAVRKNGGYEEITEAHPQFDLSHSEAHLQETVEKDIEAQIKKSLVKKALVAISNGQGVIMGMRSLKEVKEEIKRLEVMTYNAQSKKLELATINEPCFVTSFAFKGGKGNFRLTIDGLRSGRRTQPNRKTFSIGTNSDNPGIFTLVTRDQERIRLLLGSRNPTSFISYF